MGGNSPGLHIAAAVVAGALLLVSTFFPGLVFCGGLAVLTFWPVYAPQYVIPHLYLTAGTDLLGFVVLGVALRGGLRDFRANAVDLAFALLLLAMSISVLVGSRRLGVFGGLCLQWGVPYFAARLALGRYLELKRFAGAVTLAAIATIPFALAELLTKSNVFFGLAYSGRQAGLANSGRLAATWAVPDPRGTAFRVETSFGHPLAFGFVLALAALCALSLAIVAASPRGRVAWAAAAAALTLTLFLADARTSWVVLAVGSALMLIKARRTVIIKAKRLGAWRLSAATVGGGVVACFPPIPPPVTLDRLHPGRRPGRCLQGRSGIRSGPRWSPILDKGDLQERVGHKCLVLQPFPPLVRFLPTPAVGEGGR